MALDKRILFDLEIFKEDHKYSFNLNFDTNNIDEYEEMADTSFIICLLQYLAKESLENDFGEAILNSQKEETDGS